MVSVLFHSKAAFVATLATLAVVQLADVRLPTRHGAPVGCGAGRHCKTEPKPMWEASKRHLLAAWRLFLRLSRLKMVSAPGVGAR